MHVTESSQFLARSWMKGASVLASRSLMRLSLGEEFQLIEVVPRETWG